MASSHGRFIWYELMTMDMAAAKAFYARVVGWNTHNTSMPGAAYTLFAAGKVPVGGLVNLPRALRMTGTRPHWIGYVAVDDVDTASERVEELGGTVHVAPTDVPNISRFSVIGDPQMATLALVKGLKPGQEPLAEPGEPGRVGWHELLAADWRTAFAFYSELFGWQKADAHTGAMGTYQQFSVAGQAVGGMFTKPEALPVSFWLYYFNVGDIEAAAQRVEAAGGEILYGPTVVPGGAQIVHCTDPQGAVFALLDRRGRKAPGYFESAAAHDSPPARRRPWSW